MPEKEAAWNYAQKLIIMRGHNLGQDAAVRNGLVTTDAARQDDSYSEGYNAADAPQQDEQGNPVNAENDIKRQYDEAEADMKKRFGENSPVFDDIDKDTDDIVSRVENSDLSEEDKAAVKEYITKRTAWQGMMQRAKDDIQDAAEEAEWQVDSHVSPEEQGGDGMIHPATLKAGNRRVYVISGHVAMTPDGTAVDRSQSDKTIVVRDPQTGRTEMVAPGDILAVEEPQDAAQAKAEAAEQAREQAAEQRADRIDGLTPHQNPQTGDAVWVKDENGEPVRGQITQTDELSGQYFVQTERPVAGKNNQPFTPGQLYDATPETTPGTATETSPETAPETTTPETTAPSTHSVGTQHGAAAAEDNAQETPTTSEPVQETPAASEQPVGQNRFGNVYQWAVGKAREAANFLRKMQGGYLRGVFHRDDIGDIDMAWGNEKGQ